MLMKAPASARQKNSDHTARSWNPSLKPLSHSWCNETVRSPGRVEWRRSNLLTATPRLRGTGFGNGSAPSRVGSSGAIGYAKVSGGRPYAPLPWPQHLPPWLSCGSRFSPILTAWIFPAFLGWREALEERNRPPGGYVGSRRKRQNRSSKKTEKTSNDEANDANPGGKYAYRGWSGKYDNHHHYGHYRRYGYYPWYGLPLYSYGGGCADLYRRAGATGSAYWWDRYRRCSGVYKAYWFRPSIAKIRKVAYLSPIFRSSLYCAILRRVMPGLDLIVDHNAPLRRGAFNGRDVLRRRQDAAARSFERFLHKRDILFNVALEIGDLDLGDEKDWSGVLGAEPLDRGDAKSKTRQDG